MEWLLMGAPIQTKSKTQSIVTLSVTEAELVAAVDCVQTMLFARQIILSMGLRVKLPMLLEMDNKGGKDIINSWAVGGRTRHIDVRMFFLRELNEEGILKCNWISTDDNSSDLFTKNLDGPTFLRHGLVYVAH